MHVWEEGCECVHVPYTYVTMIVHSNAYTTLTVNTLTGVKLIKS